MAAGAYKSLTIRIGGDTTKLSSALRGANSAIYKTQAELNKLSRAAKIDPGNKTIERLQLGAMAQQAVNSVKQIDILKKGIDELGSVKVLDEDGKETNQTIAELADGTDSVRLKAEEANEEYTKINGELENAYKDIKAITGIDLAKATRAGNFGMAMRSAATEAIRMGVNIDDQLSTVMNLKDRWTAASSAKKNYEDAAKLDSLNNDLGVADTKLKKLVSSYVELRRQQNLGSKSSTGSDVNITQIDSRMALLSAAASTAMERFRALDAAARIDPSNIDIARQRADALAEAIDATQRHAEELRSKIAQYESSGFDASAEDARNLSTELEEAKARYDSIEHTMESVSQEMIEAGHAAEVFASEANEAGEGLSETGEEADEVQTRFRELNQARKEALDDLNTAKARAELANMKAELVQDESKVKSLGNAFASIKVTSNIAAGLKPLEAQLKVMSAGVDTAKSRFERLNNVAQVRPLNIGVAVERIRALGEVTESTRKKAELLQKKMDAFKAAGIDKIANRTKDVATAYEQAQKKVNDLNQKLSQTKRAQGENSAEAKRLEAALQAALKEADTAAAVNEFRELEVQMRENETVAKQLQSSMKSSTGGVGAAAVQAASQMGQLAQQAGQKIITSSNDIDASYRNLRKTFDATEDDYKKLYDAAMKYSQSNVTSADTMLNMESIAAQLGVGIDGGADAIQHFAEVAANLDVATDIDAETIALQMGQIVNVMDDLDNKEPKSITGFADALVRLGNNMPTQESNIMQITQRLSAIGNVAGFSTPQLMGWAAAIASTGQKSEAAASGIATTITKISTAVSSGGDDLKKWAKVANMSAEDFKKAWQNDPSKALKDVIRGLKDSGDQLFATLTDVDVNGVRQTQTLSALAQTIDTVDTAIGMADNAFNGVTDTFGQAGDAANEAGKKAEGFSGTLAKLENSGQVLAATFGDAMVPWMKMATTAIQDLTKYMNGLSDDTKSMGVLIGGAFAAFATAEPIVAALGGNFLKLATGIGKVSVKAIGKISKGFESLMMAESIPSALATGVGKLGSKLSGFAGALGSVISPLGLFATAMVAAVAATAGFVYFKWKEAQDHAKELNDLFQGMRDNVSNLKDTMGTAPEAMDDYTRAIRDSEAAHEDFFSSLKEHNERNAEIRGSMEETIGRLEYYKDVVHECAGQEEISAEKKVELQNALDGIAEITGEVYDIEDVLTDKYRDQTGAVNDTTDAIDKLIAAKEREARVSAITEMYSDAIKEQIKGQQAVRKTQEAYDEAYKAFQESDYGETVRSGLVAQGVTGEAFGKSMELAFKTGTEEGEKLWQQLQDDQAALEECDSEASTLRNTLSDTIKEGQKAGEIGVREARILGNKRMREAAEAVGLEGDALKAFCVKVRDATSDLADSNGAFTSITSRQFEAMSKQCGGNVDDLANRVIAFARLDIPDKESAVFLDDGSLKTATGEIYVWNGTELVPKEADVEVDGAEEANAELDSIQENASEGADLDVDADTDELSDANAEIDETQANAEEGANANITTSGTENIDNAVDALKQLTDAQVNISFNVDDGGISKAKSALDELDNKDIKVSISADTAGASAITDALSSLSGKPVDVKINADTSGADQITTALASLSDKPVNVKINADTSGANQVTTALASLSDKPVNVKIDADTSGADQIKAALASITDNPVDVKATITAVTNNVAAATTRIQKLNEASSAMKSQKKTYTAAGNAATSTSPASNINSLNAAAANMGGRSASYNAYGNAANGSAAAHIWDLVRAINALYSKSITVTTNYVNNGSPGKKATGAYIPPNKVPKHAAGIFTKPTLTNIGWVGESGAELYSGNSLVPLTNRKYSMPYINDISDAVAKKIGASGDTYNVNIDGARINDDPAIQAAILNLFDVLQRKGAMNVG